MSKVIFISGGSRGIGRATALHMARQGWDVVFTYHSAAQDAEALAAEIAAMGRRAAYYQCDIADLDALSALVRRAHDAFGHIDALLSNAANDRRFSILSATPENMRAMTDNLYSAQMLLVSNAAKWMIRDGIAGSIVLTSSVHGQMPTTSDFAYGGMKAALERSCKSLALELSPYRIRVNCVAPGAINVRNIDDSTLRYPYRDMVPLGRWGAPEDIAAAVAYLVSDGASYVTGQTLTVDGGFALPGLPEGWAQAYPVDTGFVRKAYEKWQSEGEDDQ